MQLANAADSQNFPFFTGIAPLRHQGHFPIVVNEANPRKALVANPLAQFQGVEIAQINRLFRQTLVETHQRRFILRANGANIDRCAVAQGPGGRVLNRIRADGRPGQRCRIHGRVQHHPRIQGNQRTGGSGGHGLASLAGEEGIDVNFLNPGLFHHQLAETHQELLQGGQVHGGPAAYPLQGFVNPGLFHHPPSQSGVERGQAQGAIAEHLHQLTAQPKQQHGAKLWIHTTAQN